MFITNAFSINMLLQSSSVSFEKITTAEAADYARRFNGQSAIGHADTTAIFSNELGMALEANRTNVSLTDGSMLLVGQYTGPRLPEGTTVLPDGAKIQWWLVSI